MRFRICHVCECSKPPSLYFVPGETISRMEREVVECEARGVVLICEMDLGGKGYPVIPDSVFQMFHDDSYFFLSDWEK